MKEFPPKKTRQESKRVSFKEIETEIEKQPNLRNKQAKPVFKSKYIKDPRDMKLDISEIREEEFKDKDEDEEESKERGVN